jgi:hypothetical protein
MAPTFLIAACVHRERGPSESSTTDGDLPSGDQSVAVVEQGFDHARELRHRDCVAPTSVICQVNRGPSYLQTWCDEARMQDQIVLHQASVCALAAGAYRRWLTGNFRR